MNFSKFLHNCFVFSKTKSWIWKAITRYANTTVRARAVRKLFMCVLNFRYLPFSVYYGPWAHTNTSKCKAFLVIIYCYFLTDWRSFSISFYGSVQKMGLMNFTGQEVSSSAHHCLNIIIFTFFMRGNNNIIFFF